MKHHFEDTLQAIKKGLGRCMLVRDCLTVWWHSASDFSVEEQRENFMGIILKMCAWFFKIIIYFLIVDYL